MLVAVEPSADAIGVKLFERLKEKWPDAQFSGCGGKTMIDAGFSATFSSEGFAVMGFTDVAKVLPEAYKRASQLAKLAAADNTDLVIFIDGWFFSRLTAKRMRKRIPTAKLVKYVAPQVWASRPQRIDFVKDHFDLVLTLLPFEPPIFEAQGIKTAFVGNPTYEEMRNAETDVSSFKSKYCLKEGPILLVLPGSRSGEVRRLGSVFCEAVRQIKSRHSDVQPVVIVAPSVADALEETKSDWPAGTVFVPGSDRFDAFAAATAAIAASGTVSTELALAQTPHVVAYKVDALTMAWANRVMTTEFVTILNIDANREIIPEFLQEDCLPDNIVSAVTTLLASEEVQQQQIAAFEAFGQKLAPPQGDPVSAAMAEIEKLMA